MNDGSMMYFISDLEMKNIKGQRLHLDCTLYTAEDMCDSVRIMASFWDEVGNQISDFSLQFAADTAIYEGRKIFDSMKSNELIEHRFEFSGSSEPILYWLNAENPWVSNERGTWVLTKKGDRAIQAARFYVLNDWEESCFGNEF
jgi:hypothetical protein